VFIFYSVVFFNDFVTLITRRSYWQNRVLSFYSVLTHVTAHDANQIGIWSTLFIAKFSVFE